MQGNALMHKKSLEDYYGTKKEVVSCYLKIYFERLGCNKLLTQSYIFSLFWLFIFLFFLLENKGHNFIIFLVKDKISY